MGSQSSKTASIKNCMGLEDGPYTYDQLKEIERRRRSILTRTEWPFYRIILCWDGTCLRLLVKDPLMWATMIIYIAVRIQLRVGNPIQAFEEMTEVANLTGIGAFLTFFLVFFVDQSYGGLNDQYGKSMGCETSIFEVASMARAALPRENSLRIVRYMNAAHVLGYVGVSEIYTKTNFFDELNKTHVMLTEREYKRVLEIDMNLDGSAYSELITWALIEVQRALKSGLIDLRQASDFRNAISDLRKAVHGLYDYADQPVPFFYVHFLCLLSTFFLPLLAIEMAYGVGSGNDYSAAKDIYAGLIVLIEAIFVVGMRLIGQKLSDPYGSDIEDLSVMHYVNFTWLRSNRILAARSPEEFENLSATVERGVVRQRSALGHAWKEEDDDQPMKPEEAAEVEA